MRSYFHSTTLDVIPTARALAATALLAFLATPLTGCELVLGMSGHTAQEAPDSSAPADASDADAPDTPAVCALPSMGDATARVTNVFPARGKLDFCIKPDSGAPIGPILSTAGCPGGLEYKDSTTTFRIPSGSYEVDLVKGGGKCSDKPVASLPHVTFDPGTTTNVVAMGDGQSDISIKTFHESAIASSTASKFRFVHALDGAPNQDVGIADHPLPPAKINPVFFKNVAFGTTSPSGSGPGGSIDANGYVDVTGSGISLNFGRANTGTTDALDVGTVKLVATVSYTMYAVGKVDSTGKPSDPAFPTEMLLCDEKTVEGTYFARCGNALTQDIGLDVFNTQLSGAFAQAESTRRTAIPPALAALGSDVVCVTEIWSEADKQAVISAAKSKYPYSVHFVTDQNTPIDDPTDQSGAVPTPPTTPACPNNDGTPSSAANLEAYLTCLEQNCAVKPNDPTSTIQDEPSDCISANCTAQAAPILFASDPRCWDCMTAHSFGRASFDQTKTECETDPNARYAFGGQNGVLLLSRYPIDTINGNTGEMINLPATDFRVSVLRAPITIDGGAKLDVYCGVMTTPATGSTRPYAGLYGTKGVDPTMEDPPQLTSDDMWREELQLQVQKLGAAVAAKSGKRRAVVLGDYYTGPQIGTSLTALNPESFSTLTALLPQGAADNYTPTCTFCSDNPIISPPGSTPAPGTSYWSSYGVLSNIPVTDVRSNSVILKDATVPYKTYKIPLSTYYGFRTVVRVRP